ncbi:MAG: polyphosphate kinase 1 [Alphaproteobacteria bacterium]|nr:polyphosphate kinase 1 [Alphaproteobacteria bacterium]
MGRPVEPEPSARNTRYLDRELSWLQFNRRVLEEALDPANPLLERLRFLTIFHTNLDEFFMIRVSGIQHQIAAGVDSRSVDGLTPRMRWAQVLDRVGPLVEAAQRCLTEEIFPGLARHGVHLVDWADLSPRERQWSNEWFERKAAPILTPLAVGPTHPFPFISNLSLNLAVDVESPEGEHRLARVKVPLINLPRAVPLAGVPFQPPVRLVLVEQIVAANLPSLFPGMKVGQPWMFRVTRDADIEIREDEADDLVSTIQQELRRRRFGHAVRLEVQKGMPASIRDALVSGLDIEQAAVMEIGGPLSVPRMADLLQLDLPDLKYPPFNARPPVAFDVVEQDPFAVIRARDVVVHHPFESFSPVVDLVRIASRDPQVVAIKQTLYRTSGDSPIIAALEEAIENGKQVAAVVELKARFDEQNNIVWAQRLENQGVHVVYGVPGLKTHAKLMLIVRREGDELIRYAHLGTGNYNPTTARVYTDLGLFTADPEITADVANLFNQLTGFARPPGFRRLLVAPSHLKPSLLDLIAWETEQARQGLPAAIVIKCNGVTDHDVIDALYEASRAGVRVDLIVRGICCLRPGVPGLSDNIRVRSVVGRFLEHDRIFWFANGGSPRCYIGSSDLMERNLERRVEVVVPVLDPGHATWLREVHLARYLQDRARTREMQRDGSYVRLRSDPDDPDVHAQFMASR